MPSQNKDCYLAINGKKYGPISEADIQALFDKNKISGDTKFARKGMSEWITLSESGIIPDLEDDDGLPPLPHDNIDNEANDEEPLSSGGKGKVWFVSGIIGIVIIILAIMANTPQGIENVQPAIDNPQYQETTPEAFVQSEEAVFTISDFDGVFRGRAYPFDPMIVVIDDGKFFRYSRVIANDEVNTFMLFTGEIEGLRYEESDRIFAVDNMEWHDVHYDAVTGERVYHHVFNRPVAMEFITIDHEGRLIMLDANQNREYFDRISGNEIPYFMNMQHLAHVLR